MNVMKKYMLAILLLFFYSGICFSQTNVDATYFRLRNSTNSVTYGGFSQRGLWEGNSNIDPAIWSEGGYGLFFYTNGNGTPKMTITPGGNIGIGLSSPSAALHINATSSAAFKVTRNGSNTYGYEIGGSTFGLYDYTSDNYRWLVDGNNLLLNHSAGNVGIGTMNPTTLLDVTKASTDGVAITVRNTQSGTGALSGLRIGNNLAVNRFEIFTLSSSYTQAGPYYPDGTSVANEGTGGLSLGALNTLGNVRIYAGGNGDSYERMRVATNGNVGIGTTTPSEKLSVDGNISTKKLIVTQTGWSDYVFTKGYKLRSLQNLEAFISQNKHLPEVPTAKEVAAKGISVGDNQALLLKKIEELTLYMIEMNKTNDQMKAEIKVQAKEIRLLKQMNKR